MNNKGNNLGKKIAVIYYTEFWDRINYYGLQAVLILFLINRFGFSDKQTYLIYGVYTALSYGFCVLGGIIADRFLGLYYSVFLGSIFIAFGNILLIYPDVDIVYLGLAIITTGISILKPNNPSLLGSIFQNNTSKRAKTFSIFYLCINIGSILGPLIYGWVSQNNSYWISFLCSAFGLLTVTISMLFVKDRDYINTQSFTKFFQAFAILLICVISGYLLLQNPNFSALVVTIIFITAILYTGLLIKKLPIEQKIAVGNLLLPFLAALIFFIFSLQLFSSITLFIDRYLDKTVNGFQVPTMWFSSIEPVCIIFAVPILNYIMKLVERKYFIVSDQTKVALGLMVAGCAFLSFSLLPTAILLNKALSYIVLILANILLAFSELWIIPITMSLTNTKAPQNYKGTFMGLFYFSLALSGYLSGVVSRYSPKINSPIVDFSYFFIKIATILFIFGLLLIFSKNIYYRFISIK